MNTMTENLRVSNKIAEDVLQDKIKSFIVKGIVNINIGTKFTLNNIIDLIVTDTYLTSIELLDDYDLELLNYGTKLELVKELKEVSKKLDKTDTHTIISFEKVIIKYYE